MTEILKSIVGKTLAILAFGTIVLLALALPQHKVGDTSTHNWTADPPPQVVFQYILKQPDGSIVVVPSKEQTVAMALMPITPGRAPLPPGSLMICHGITTEVGLERKDGVSVGNLTEIGFRCGDDLYIFKSLDIH